MKEKIYNVVDKPKKKSSLVDILLYSYAIVCFITFVFIGYNEYSPIKPTSINVSNTKINYDYLKSVTVKMRGSDELRSWSGTGVIIKNEDNYAYLITNNHVCPKKASCYVVVEDDIYIAERVKGSDERDIVLIKVELPILNKGEIKGVNNVTHQDRVFTVGHSLGRNYLYGEGTVAGFHDALIVSLPAIYGSSGSGIFNTEGELVGLLYGVVMVRGDYSVFPDPGHAYCVDGLFIKKFLKGII